MCGWGKKRGVRTYYFIVVWYGMVWCVSVKPIDYLIIYIFITEIT